MRELLSAFSGNELVLGIVLGNWLLLTGAGASLGRIAPRLPDPLGVLIVAQVAVALLPVASVFLLRTLRDVVFTRGAVVGVTETVVGCLVLLAPYCLITGLLLTLASLVLASQKGSASIGQVYFLDNVGDVIGGVLFSFVLVYLFDHFQILYVPALLNLAFAALVAAVARRRALALAIAIVTTGLGLIPGCDLDAVSTCLQYPEEVVKYRGNSPYGRVVVTAKPGQVNFYENGVPLFSTGRVDRVEEPVHLAMAQRPDARRVLLISGGISGTAREILKYGGPDGDFPVLDYVELDPLIIQVGSRYVPENLADPQGRIRVHNTDGRLFLRQTPERYDVIIVDVPDPSTSQLNRFYTEEFFEEAKGRLTPGGVLSISLGHYENFLSPELADLIAVAHRTLRRQFEHVLMLPAGRIVFLASDGPLVADVAGVLERRKIPTLSMGRHRLEGDFTPARLAAVRRAIREDAPVNKDFSPILYYYHLRYWISQFRVRFGLLVGGLGALLVVWLFRARPVTFALFTTGLAASALEVVLLVGFQILYGCVYHRVGLIVTMFMLGLGIGSWTMNRMLARRTRRDLAKLELAIAVFAALVPVALVALGRIGDAAAGAVASQAGIPLLALALAVLVGLEFPLAGKAAFTSVSATAARLYTADYLGAALGALLVSTLLIPVMGVVAVCLLAAGLNLLSGLVILVTSRG